MVSIRAVYKNGQLQPLEPIDLAEGQEVQLHIVDDQQDTLAAIADFMQPDMPAVDVPDDFDEVALQQQIDEAVQNVTISDLIIEERRTGR
jgi:predicted DNA-binding antitoxin AbrB/MazE fold protein